LIDSGVKESAGRVEEGTLKCSGCSATYPIINFIPRFVPITSYADSFGFQWNQYAKTQIGGDQKAVSKNRWEILNNWTGDYTGQKMLEAGCGAGRFSEIALDLGVELYSFDLSRAVDAAQGNIPIGYQSKHHLCQASIYDIPLPPGMFEKVFCMGVLQHTPDVKKSFMCLVPFVKPGGELAIDCYPKERIWNLFNPFHLKYWLRPFFCWWRPTILHAFLKFWMSLFYDIKRVLTKVQLIGELLGKLLPIGIIRHRDGTLSVAEVKEIKTLSAMDILGARFDKPQSIDTIKQWAREAGLEMVDIKLGFNGINALMRKPA